MYVTGLDTLFLYNSQAIKNEEGNKTMQKRISPKKFYKKWYIQLSLVGLLVAGALVTLYIQEVNKPVNNQSEVVIAQSDPRYITYTAIAGKTSLEQLKESTSDVGTQITEYGEYVDSIGQFVGRSGGNFWSFYVDGEMSGLGADSYMQKGGEKIEWKYQNLQ